MLILHFQTKVEEKPKSQAQQAAETPKKQKRSEKSQATADDEEESKKKRKKRKVMGLEIGSDVDNELKNAEGEPSVRQSRRIAQLKIKKEADKCLIEEIVVGEDDKKHGKHKKKHEKHKDKKSGDKKKRKKRSRSSDEDEVAAALAAAAAAKEREKEEKERRRKERRRKRKMQNKFDESKPWQSSSGSSSTEVENEPEEEEEFEYHESEGSPLFRSDHEFSPESDLEKDDADQGTTPLKRARTAQKSKSDDEEDEYACQKCNKSDHPDMILLCDTCDKGWHCSCLRPALMLVPEGDWFCPPCQHNLLVIKLQERLKIFDQATKRHEVEALRKKRLAYVGISLDNVLAKDRKTNSRESSEEESSESDSSSGSSSSDSSSDESEPVYQLRERRCAATSYKFNEYDDMINAAIKDEVDAVQVKKNYNYSNYLSFT